MHDEREAAAARARRASPWVRPVARALGSAARVVVDGARRVTGPQRRAGAGEVGDVDEVDGIDRMDDASVLVRQLQQRVQEAGGDPTALIDDPVFWTVVRRLGRVERRRAGRRSPTEGTLARATPDAAADEADAVEADGVEADGATEADAIAADAIDAIGEDQAGEAEAGIGVLDGLVPEVGTAEDSPIDEPAVEGAGGSEDETSTPKGKRKSSTGDEAQDEADGND